MSIRLRELIRAVRNCKTAAEERAVVAKECAAIRTAIKENSPYKARNVAKLMYIHMMGYPTAFGQMECINLIVSSKYPEKRIGYLALMTLLDETQEVLPLVEHSLKKDLSDKNQFIQSLALTTIANIGSEDLCRDLTTEVEKLLFHSPYIRKKAALCSVRIIRKCPDLIENYLDKIEQLLNEKNHGVLLTAITMMIEISKISKKYRNSFRKLIPTLLKMQKSLLMSAYALEHDVNGVADPFLQVNILRLLKTLAKGSSKAIELINDTLVNVMTNTDHNKNSGNAILYECVTTILDIDVEAGLRNMAIKQLGSFLVNRENNLRFVALQTLIKVAETDSQSVNRHLNTIVDCLKDHDLSIRKRALELIYALVNSSTIKKLVAELVNYLQHSNDELKEEITTKVCTLVERYSPNKEWQINTLLQLITLAGQYVREDVASNFIALVSQTPDMQSTVVNHLFITLKNLAPKPHLLQKQDTLLQVAVWCIGEFRDPLKSSDISENEVTDLLVDLLNSPQLSSITKATAITSLTKICAISSQTSKISSVLKSFKSHHDAELQQRSCEFDSLIDSTSPQIREKVLSKMPPIPVKQLSAVSQNKSEPNVSESESKENLTEEKSDLLLIVDDMSSPDHLSNNQNSDSQNSKPSNGSENATSNSTLLDIFGEINTENHSQPVSTTIDDILGVSDQQIDIPVSDPLEVKTTIYHKDGLEIQFQAKHQPPDLITVTLFFNNHNSEPLTNLEFLAAVPNYLKMKLFKPSSNEIPPVSKGKVDQVMKLKNPQQKQTTFRFKVQCMKGSEKLKGEGAVPNL